VEALSEGVLVAPVADDVKADFTDWVVSRQHRMLRTAYLMTGDLHRAEDLLQEALIKVALRWPKLRDGNPDAFVRTVLYRDNVSWWRRRRESPAERVTESAARHDADATERGLLVRQALATLTAKQRAVLVLRYFDDLTERETAEILGVSIGTVKSQTSAALTRLRERAPELADLINETGR
jgi:RNA polymerase sigma-70 factor (sigma-E family)